MLYRFPFLLASLIVSYSFGQPTIDHRKEALSLAKMLTQEHLQPKQIDDHFSAQVFDQFLDVLDPDKLYFTASDIQTLLPYRSKLDDELAGRGWDFFNQALVIYKKSLLRAEDTILKISSSPVTANAKEFYTLDTTTWANTHEDLRNKWRIWLKYQVLARLTDLYSTENEKDFFNKAEPSARDHVKAHEIRSVKRITNHPTGFENYILSKYLNSIAAVFDPHTVYLSANDMENFLSSISTEGYYFGITLSENDRGDVVISGLAPGGPAWKSGELHKSDVIINLQWEGQAGIEASGFSLEDANLFMSDARHNMLNLTVRTTGGLEKTVKLQKEKLSLEENFVRSYMLSGTVKIGYISLPDFYTQWGDESEGARCANDVAKEILKLKKENIDGLILDIRNNGGGSMLEAVALAGIFVDEGPMGILKNNKNELTVLKDMNRGTVYDGPLLVMVNGQSASASEFLAGVLQDYNRAIIAGSRTFGKATFQNFFPLDPTQKEPTLDNVKTGFGYASITGGKFYRITGRSAQGTGVTPDIHLPDLLEGLVMYESEMPFVLSSDSVNKKTFYKKLADLPAEQLNKKSKTRQLSSASFLKIAEGIKAVSQTLELMNKPVSLTWADFKDQTQASTMVFADLQQSFSTETAAYDVITVGSDEQRLAIDEYAKELSQKWKDNLKHDMYVEEAFLILGDMINNK